MSGSFTHLHVHTEYSMLDGAARLDELVAKAVADGQPALGITDHGNMYGVVEFYKECRKQGIKPVLGIEAYMAHESRTERLARRGRMDDNGGTDEGGKKQYYHLTLLSENDTGYRNLIQLSSLAFLEGYHYVPRMDWDLLARHSDGLIATTGCLGGHVLQSLVAGDREGALRKAARLQDIFGKDNLFVELQDHGLPDQKRTNPMLVEIAAKIGAPLIVTNDSHYVHQHDHEAHDALLCVQTGAVRSDPGRFKFTGEEFYLKSADEMRALWKELPEACDNTLWVAERAEVNIEFGVPKLPVFPIPPGFDGDAAYLAELTMEGARRRWGDDVPAAAMERLRYELSTIDAMGFNSYFLIVWDLIRYARESGIRVGPGRGSAAGCAVAYCLGITDLDPLRYDLIFERFLNPSRISMPDIDMDFDSRYRDTMIRYAADKYGRDHVAQIITFATIKARNAVRDAARVLGYEYAVGDRIAKAMPPLVNGRDTPLRHCFDKHDSHLEGWAAAAELRAMYESDPDVKAVVDVAKGLEGLKRSGGIHAAAVVITPEPLTEYLPIQRKPSGDDETEAPIVTQYEMHAVEDLGLLKMDFLGLRNLDVITDTVEMIRADVDPAFDIDAVPLDDAATFELLGRGDTIGVFQLESPPMRALLRSMRPSSFEDVCAVIALYRPGPMSANMHNDYADYKNKRKEVRYFHPDAAEILDDTYGLMVYQESMMRVAQKFAGYDMAQADNLRKACGKKIREMMAKEREQFVDGCERTGYDRALGESLFDIIENFADYAFNKSHAYGYGLVAYQTAFLKAHYPVHYAACLLTSVKGNYDKAAVHLADARASEISVLTPDVNASGRDFTADIADDGRRVRFGLSAVRNVGEGIVEMLVAEREANGPFESFHDFAERVPEPVLNKRALESLIKAGAFDSLGHPRRGLLLVFEQIVDTALATRREREVGVISLFGGDDDASGWSERVAVPDLHFEKMEQLRLEKEMLGMYVSDHPLMGIQGALRRRAKDAVVDLAEAAEGPVEIGGLVTSLQRRYTRKGDQMAVFVLEDLDASIEVTVFARVLADVGHLLAEDAIVVVSGRLVRRDEGRVSVNARSITRVEGLSETPAQLHLRMAARALSEDSVSALKQILTEHPGDCSVVLHLGDGLTMPLGDDFTVDFDKVLGPLRVRFGPDVVSV